MGNLQCMGRMGDSLKHTFRYMYMILNVTNQKSNSYDTSFQVQDRQLSGVTKEYSDDSLDGNRCIKNSAISKGVQSSKNGATTPKQAIDWRSEQVNIGSITRAPPCSDEWSCPQRGPEGRESKGRCRLFFKTSGVWLQTQQAMQCMFLSGQILVFFLHHWDIL